MTRELESRKDLVDEKVTRHDGSQENAPSPLALAERGGAQRLGEGFSNNNKYEPRPYGCNTRKLVNNRFPARKGWGLCSDNPNSLINVKKLKTYRLNVLTTSRKFGFTLAEILVTLGVIGIVAAMTIPTLINNYQEKVTVTKVKKMYSTLSQAVKLASVDYGNPIEWDLPLDTKGGSQKLYGYLKPYLKVSKECVEDNSGNCLDTSAKYTQLNGETWATSETNIYGGKGYARIILADGSLLWLRSNGIGVNCGDADAGFQDVCAMFWYDVNGSAAPNTMAKDIFVFVLRPSGIYPYSFNECYLDDHGWACSKWIIENDNMDYPATKSTDD